MRLNVRSSILGAALLASLSAACVQTGVDSYEGFRSAVDSGASCRNLIEIQENFDGTPDEDRVAADLEEIGCETPESTRSDR